MKKIIKDGFQLFFISTFFSVLVLVLFSNAVKANVINLPDDEKWENYNDSSKYTVISDDTTWSGNMVFNDTKKPVIVVDGATLTIEKGTHININSLTVSYGRIVAEGTAEDNIVFSRASFDPDVPYDCNTGVKNGYIEFDDWSWDDGMEPSIFRYVEFSSMGQNVQLDDAKCHPSGGGVLSNIFFPIVQARTWPVVTNPSILFRNGRVQIKNCSFHDGADADIEVNARSFGDWEKGQLEVVDSNFTISGRIKSDAKKAPTYQDELVSDKDILVLKNDWYGAAEGPSVSHIFGEGDDVTVDYTLDGWSDKEFANTVTAANASNVLFLPGIEASRLYAKDDPDCHMINCENQLWEPNLNADVEKLFLNDEGKSTDQYDIYTRDILDEANILPLGRENIYESFIDKMNDMKNKDKSINDWESIPYDWRLSLEDIVNGGRKEGENISYNNPTESPYVISELSHLAASSKTGKVTIVAHSNGGLVAKALMEKLGDTEAKNLVDKIIFVAVPQVGTPAAMAGMLHGQSQDIIPVLNVKTARGLAENMPGAYNLLPSEKYFSTVATPVLNFKLGESFIWKGRYDDSIASKEKMDNFLEDDLWRMPAISSDVDTPSKLNRILLEEANAVHKDLDDWVAPDGIKIIQIAGWGVPKTVSYIDYNIVNKNFCDGSICAKGTELLDPDFKFTIDGDGTVVTPSALWMNGVDRYWVDIKEYDTDHNWVTVAGRYGPDHKNILEFSSLLSFINDNIENKTKDSSEYKYIYGKVPDSTDGNRLQYSLHSPLTLGLYDEKDRHTGINKDNQIEEQIPGTYYQQYGDVKYIFSDEDSSQRIVMDGYDEGTFTFSVDELQGDKKLGNITFKDMPTTPKTKVVFDIANSLASASKMKIDEDGDGVFDFEAVPIQNGVVTSTDLMRIEKSIQVNNLDNDSGDGNDKDEKGGSSHNDNRKNKKASTSVPVASNIRMASVGTKLADAFIVPKTIAYSEAKNKDPEKEEDRRDIINNDLKNKETIGMEEIYSLIVLLLVIIIGFGWWRREVTKKV